MQLVAYGAQDIYLTGNPQITFFKVVYRRHTNFSMESIAQTWSGNSDSPGRSTATISRNGDLIYRMYLEVDPVTRWEDTAQNPGSQGIKSVELEIGGQKIDKHTGTWMETWAELTQPNPTGLSGDLAVAGTDNTGTFYQMTTGMGGAFGADAAAKLFVPLQFWFCCNVGLALPLIALQYHEVKVILDHDWNGADNGISVGKYSNTLWVDYIYLDTDERRRFAQVSHEYLIEQVQEQDWSTSNKTLTFNHPVKELIWIKENNSPTTDNWGPTAALGDDWQLKLNGHDRFASRDFRYFTRVQVYQHHSGVGGLGAATAATPSNFADSIAVYSFALKPEEHQPSGTCNFSRIDNAVLESNDTGVIRVYAVNYNVLRIMSGMGGLAYSN